MQYIGTFKTESGSEYVYDGMSNMIIPADEGLLSALKQVAFDRDLLYENASEKTKQLIDKWGLFKKRELSIDRSFIYKEIREYPYPQIVLGITEDCNLRCKYCIFSGDYDNMREHNKRVMSKEIAIKSVDKFIEYVREWQSYAPEKQPVISFYGGEPILEMDMIKEIVDYVKGMDFDVMFALTTNGTLLTDELIKYFVDNNFVISVSLDGAKEIHDKNRVFVNGEGTFDHVYDNLKRLQKEIERQNKQDVLPTMVLSCYENDTEMDKMNDFFVREKDFLSKLGGRVSEVIPTYDSTEKRAVNESMGKVFRNYMQALLDKENVSKKDMYFLERIFGTLLKTMYSRNIYTNGEEYASLLGNSCIPGSKIFVSVDGDFHMCERINYSFPIGSYVEGLNIEKIEAVVDKWVKTFGEHCSSCPYKAICGLCYAGCAEEEEFNIKKICKTRRKDIERQLSILYTILEKNPEALNFFTSNKDIINEKFMKYKSILNNC